MKVQTGNMELNADIQELVSALSSGRVTKIRQAIERESLTEQQFIDWLPDGALRLAWALSSEAGYEGIRKLVIKDAIPTIEQVREGVGRQFESIFGHPLTEKRLQGLLASKSGQTRRRKTRDNVKTVSSISHIPMWLGQSPELVPAARVIFHDERDKVLLDSTFTWNDLLFVINSFAKILLEHMAGATTLITQKNVDTEQLQVVKRWMGEIQENLSQLKGLSSGYEGPARQAGLPGQSQKEPGSTKKVKV